MDERERLRAKMIENAAEINCLHRRIHETVKRRGESEELRQEWSRACQEFHANYAKLCIPGGWDAGFLDRILAGDPSTIEIDLCFLEVRPYFFRSGYHWKTILQKCKRAPISGEQSERARQLPPPHSGSGQTNSSPQIADPENEISTRRHCPLCRIGLLLLFQNLPAQRSHSP